MSKIKKEELFGNLKDFLKSKGIELQQGSYTERIRQGCGLLADSVNLSQDAVHRAKEAVDKSFDQLRQVIHEKTAPRPTGKASKPPAGGTPKPKVSVKSATNPSSKKAPRRKNSPGKK
jgi:hypothetical protein